jgi:hypothetical protein
MLIMFLLVPGNKLLKEEMPPSHAFGGKCMERNFVLYVDAELVETTKELGFNLSRTSENHLKQLLTKNLNFQLIRKH